MEVKKTFLSGELDEEIYMDQFVGFKVNCLDNGTSNFITPLLQLDFKFGKGPLCVCQTIKEVFAYSIFVC